MEKETIKVIMGEGVMRQIKDFGNSVPPKPLTKELLIELIKEEQKQNETT